MAKTRDFSGVGYDEALDRARALIPLLRKHGPDNDRATKLVPEVVNALHETGLWRYIQPKAWGDRKSTRLNSSHSQQSRMPSSA